MVATGGPFGKLLILRSLGLIGVEVAQKHNNSTHGKEGEILRAIHGRIPQHVSPEE